MTHKLETMPPNRRGEYGVKARIPGVAAKTWRGRTVADARGAAQRWIEAVESGQDRMSAEITLPVRQGGIHMNRDQLHELNEVARANLIIREALHAVTDPKPEHVQDEWLHGPRTHVFAVRPGDNQWLPVGEYLLQIYAEGGVTLAWRKDIGTGSWGPPVSGRQA